MRYPEAVSWLDQRGGRWTVHATSAACVVVVASLGTVQISAPATGLSCESVDAALVEAVDRLVRSVDSERRDSTSRPPRAFLG